MKKKMILGLFLLTVVMFSAHSQQYDNESDFEFRFVGRGNASVEIIGYNGSNTTVRIPQRIQNRPVIGIILTDYESVSASAFSNRGLVRVFLPEGLNYIGKFAFAGNQLTNIDIPNSVVVIEEGAFSNNRLTRINIPSSVGVMFNYQDTINGTSNRRRYANPFPVNPSLEFISVDPANRSFVSIDGVLFSSNKEILYAYPSAKGDAYTIPSGVIEIASMAFSGSQIERISLPNGLLIIGESAFGRANLTSITIPNSVNEIGSHAFSENGLTNITISTSIRSIEMWTFAINQLTSVIIPNNVTSIDSYAFCYNQLTSITIGANVSLGGRYGASFDNDFDDFYNRNGKRAGTYTYSRGSWSRR